MNLREFVRALFSEETAAHRTTRFAKKVHLYVKFCTLNPILGFLIRFVLLNFKQFFTHRVDLFALLKAVRFQYLALYTTS